MKALVVLLCLCFSSCVLAENKPTLRLASLEWPPYTSATMTDHGETTALLRRIFADLGYQLEIDFVPWSRAVRMGTADHPYDGYFPEYQVQEAGRLQSDSLGSSLIGFAYKADLIVPEINLQMLQRFSLGVVQDYINQHQLDLWIRLGLLKPQYALSDQQNLLKLVNGRVELIVIDQRVMDYWLQQDRKLQPYREQIRFHDQFSEQKTLHLVLNDNPRLRQLMHQLNSALEHQTRSDAAR